MLPSVRLLTGASCRLGRPSAPLSFGASVARRSHSTSAPGSSSIVDAFDNYEESVKVFQADPTLLAQWGSPSIAFSGGRSFDADTRLADKQRTTFFPAIKCADLGGKPATIPVGVDAGVKLVVLSFKHCGFLFVRSWLNPFLAEFGLDKPDADRKDFVALELCFVENSFFSMAKGLIASGVRNSVSPSQLNHTYLSFGNVAAHASALLLPHSCTGYAYLVDRENRVRWRASGEANPEEVQRMLTLARQLSAEQQTQTQTQPVSNSKRKN